MIAIAMAVSIVLWMASGLFASPEKEATAKTKARSETLMLVQTEMQEASPVKLALTIQGQVEPQRMVKVRADIAGYISKVSAQEGQWVEEGTELVHIALEDRQIKLDKEKASLLSKQKSYKRIKALAKDNLQSKSALEDAFAALKAAKANVAQIEFEIKKLTVNAPFSGVLVKRMVEQGSYVAANAEIATFVDHSVLKVVAPVAQQNIQQLQLNKTAQVTFATGEVKQGTVSYISVQANENTRTFRVEVAVDNSDRAIPSGISAEISIPTEEVLGHFVSPAILGLGEQGEMGVKTVNENNQVEFYPVNIIQASTKGIWVSGLPQSAHIITIGQGFVAAGVEVDVKQVNSATALLHTPSDTQVK